MLNPVTSLWLVLALTVLESVLCGTPAPERFFRSQIVDHLDKEGPYCGEEFTQRYYTWDKEFRGPGHPIFMIIGGEGHIPPETGLFYPFVTHHLAKTFGAFVLQPEHRFYGKSQPLGHQRDHMINRGYRHDQRVELFTSEQALHDAMNLLSHTKQKLGCSNDSASPLYCPVITVGGSYPGFLSALARIMFPDIVDMAYSASAPMLFYAQKVNQDWYYDHITKVAEESLPGCAKAVSDALEEAKELVMTGQYNETIFGICDRTTPDYITSYSMFWDEIQMVVGYSFANDNMANYPPGNKTRLYNTCETFSCDKSSSLDKLRHFLVHRLSRENATCWDMSGQLPTGENATISSGDWSGVGTGSDGESWDFQTCTREVEAIGFSESSMFPKREWSMDWLKKHCYSRFGVTPDPYGMVRCWKFDQLVETNVTKIVFTNGLKDGWSVGGFAKSLSDDLPVLNFPNGAHHSDLSGRGPSNDDSDDIKKGFQTITSILGTWLNEVKEQSSLVSPRGLASNA
eukprot:scaffold1605_cov141-Cylindrotheca_fusiformis.AAC.22